MAHEHLNEFVPWTAVAHTRDADHGAMQKKIGQARVIKLGQ